METNENTFKKLIESFATHDWEEHNENDTGWVPCKKCSILVPPMYLYAVETFHHIYFCDRYSIFDEWLLTCDERLIQDIIT